MTALSAIFWAIITALLVDGIKILAEILYGRKARPPTGCLSNDQVTAIIAARNESKQIAATIHSVRRHFKNIIVADDGSTDNTSEIAKVADPNVMVISLPARGKTAAQHSVLAEVSTPYVLFLDADVSISESFQIPDIQDNTACAFNIVPTGEGYLVDLQKYEYAKSMIISRKFQSTGSCVHCVSGAAGLFKTERLRELAKFHSGIFVGEDLERTLIELSANGKIIFHEAMVETEAPETFFRLAKQRIFGWWPGLWRNVPLIVKILFKRNAPFILRLEMVYALFSLFTDPLKIFSLAILLISGAWQVLLAVYLLYLVFDSGIFLYIREKIALKNPVRTIILFPIYSLMQIFFRTGALFTYLYSLTFSNRKI